MTGVQDQDLPEPTAPLLPNGHVGPIAKLFADMPDWINLFQHNTLKALEEQSMPA
jgi:hypothetical protein